MSRAGRQSKVGPIQIREDRRPGIARTDQRHRSDAGTLRLSTYSCLASARRLGRQSQTRLPHLLRRRPVHAAQAPRRRKSAMIRSERSVADVVNHTWSMDFMADNLADGRKIRLLTIVDNFSRECLALDVAAGFKGSDVAQALTRIVAERGRPRQIRCDNGPEFISKALDQWAYWNKVKLDFSRPGKPTDNAFIESFNGRVRQELLNASCFETLSTPAK